jgi:hypothetical protein
LVECDGVIISSAEAYESSSLRALGSWISDLSKPLYAVGPLLPPDYGTGAPPSRQGRTAELETFLDAMLSQHGRCSVFYVSCFLDIGI